MISGTIGRGHSGFGGEGHQRIGRRHLDLGEAAAHRARRDGARHLFCKRIFPAGIQDDETQTLHRIEHPHDTVERDRLVLDVDIAGKLGIDRNQVVRAVELDAVAGIVDDCDVGIFCSPGEFSDRAPHRRVAEIEFVFDDLESGLFEHRRHRRRIPGGIGERLDVLVGGVANNQCNAALGGRKSSRQHQR